MTAPLPYEKVAYPAAPWQMVGSLWLSLFRLKQDVDDLRPAGVYGAAFVVLRGGQPAHLLRAARRPAGQVRRARAPGDDHRHLGRLPRIGGRRPRALGDPEGPVRLHARDRPPRARSPRPSGRRASSRRPIAARLVHRRLPAAPRLPFKGGTWQPGSPRAAARRPPPCRGSSKAAPCRGRWEFDPDGPLGWLRGARQLASFRKAASGCLRLSLRRSSDFRQNHPPRLRQDGVMHSVVPLKVHYDGTPVVLVSSTNPDGTTNLAPMSSAWWLGQEATLGLGASSRTGAEPAAHP